MMNIPFSPPDITESEINEVVEALKSGWITTGPRTKKFEKQIADFVGTNRAVALSSATAALETTLRILGIGAGDEVIVPAYTYTATASPVVHVGATLKICDVAEDSFEMDYDKLEAMITDKTKAVIPVDLAGRMCDYDKIFEVVEKCKDKFVPTNDIQKAIGRVVLVADSAHGFGAMRNGKRSGQVADFTTYSFHAVKNLTTAEGGAVTWTAKEGIDDEYLYKQYMLYSLHGQNKDALAKTKAGAWEYDIAFPGYKCNMTDLQAAIGLKQLERYEELLARRKEIIDTYDIELKDFGIESLTHFEDDIKSSGHLYIARLVGKTERERNELITKLAERGVATNVHYKPLPMMTAYKDLGFDIKDYPNAYDMYRNEITLPLHTKLGDEEIVYIVEQIKELMK